MKNSKTILIVEDEKIVAKALSERLEKQGYTTVTVQSGEKALKAVTNNEINCILMDIELGRGEIDGAEAARQILKKREIPVVFCSAHTEKEYVDRVKDIKSYGYVHKNSGKFVLLQTVRMALELFETHQQLKAEYEKRKQAEKFFTSIVENIPNMIFLKEAENLTFYLVNRAAEKTMGMNREELIGKSDYDVFPKDEADFFRKKDLEVLEGGKEVVIQEEELAAADQVRYVYTKKVPIFDDEGKARYMLGISEDITELKKTLEEKDYLMKEINHRVKNNLMMITSLISLKNASLGDAVDLTDLKNQIDAIRIVHEKLYTTNKITSIDFKEYIDDLLNTIFSSFTERRVKVENRIEEIILTTKTAIPLGLIINEIATNAIKHGFSGIKEPLFKVEMAKSADENGCKLKLSNNGRPFPGSVELDNPSTLGLQLVTALTSQLGGSLKLRRSPHPVFTIHFPLEV